MNAEHADLLHLSPSERLLLLQDLWDSLSAEDIPLEHRGGPTEGSHCVIQQLEQTHQ